ncbi:MAG: thioredoxin family protein [Terrisporobacter sp.]|uniref:thioredoxin family protein n=1 Tax=Clostridia TaxID=186801 RepID=UPI002FC6B956
MKNPMSYKEFIDSAEQEHRVFIDSLHEQGQLLDEGLQYIKDIKEDTNIVVFTETRCEDSATTMPFLIKLAELNKKLKVSFYRREGNEEILEKLTGEKRVPTIVVLDKKGNPERHYIEFSKKLKQKLESSPIEETQSIIDDMRLGKYNGYIQEDLISFLTGKNYEYISFERKDK